MARLKKTITGWTWTDLKPGDLIPSIGGTWREVTADELDEKGEIIYTPTYVSTSTTLDPNVINTLLQQKLTTNTLEPQVCWCALPSITGNSDCCKNCPNNKNRKTDKVNVKTFTSNEGTNQISKEMDDYVTPTVFRDDIEMSMKVLSELEKHLRQAQNNKAIERIKRALTYLYRCAFVEKEDTETWDAVAVVEKEVEVLDEIKLMCDEYNIKFSLTNIREALFALVQVRSSNLDKKDKAIEIIKNKNVNTTVLLAAIRYKAGNTTNLNFYNSLSDSEELTEDEFDILKDAFEDE